MEVDHFLSPARSRDEVRAELGLTEDTIVVGKIARLFHLKGHEYLVEAAPAIIDAVPNVKFLLVGDGVLQQSLQERIAELGLTEAFIFAGLIPPDEVASYIHAMDIVVHTSVWEGLARVLPQALICGKPIISYQIDGAPEVCINRETGFLVPARSIEPLAAAIGKLAANSDLRIQLGENGRKKFADVFRHEYMTERIREVYQRVIEDFAG